MHVIIFLYSEDGTGGDVFCLMFEIADKHNFLLPKFVIGSGITIINPVMEGDWAGITTLRSASPCISGPVNNSCHIPVPFPNSVSLSHNSTNSDVILCLVC